MRLLAVVLLVGSLAAAAPAGADTVNAKVTRSTAADPGEYPAQVALLDPAEPDTYFAQFCGGSLIDSSWVLTAAHCVVDPDTATVVQPDVLLGTSVLGDGSGTRLHTATTVVHPGYAFPTNDVALLHLETPFGGQSAFLAYEGLEALETSGTPAIVTGWGARDDANTDFPADLQEGDVPVISDDACQTALAAYGDTLTDPPTQVCAGTGSMGSDEQADACQGDSGGPLWAFGPDGVRRQIGLVSGGPTCGFSPTYYQSIEAFIPYIESVIGFQLASFLDIPGDAHEIDIERITFNAFAGGLGNGLYGPGQIVSRGQMATFLANALHLEPVATGPFSDTAGTPHEQNINAVAQAGIASGFPDGTFKPSELVTRDQMATFLAKALALAGVATGPFTDVAGNVHEQNINAVAQAGIAGGFGDGTYRPRDGVTRAQMATFLARAFITA